MDSSEFMRLVDSISLERGIDKELIISDIEKALLQASEKRFDAEGDFTISIDRESGEIRAYEDDKPIELESLGRIVANVAKQVIMQRLREGERDILYDEYISRVGTVATATVMHKERRTVIMNLGRTEAVLLPEEQIPGEVYRPGSTIRVLIHKVEKKGQRIRIVLSRTHKNFVKELFGLEVPEIADGVIEVKDIVREAGRRTKIAVDTLDPRIDPVGTCVGMRGSRITKIMDELGSERIDIIPWSDDPAQFIINSLKPAAVLRVSYDAFRDRALVTVSQDQLPLAIGKAGQNVRLSARLTRFRIDVMSEDQVQEKRAAGYQQLQTLIDESLLEDFQREVFLDNHLNDFSILAAQSVGSFESVMDGLYTEDASKVQILIDRANALLNEEQQSARDEFIVAREKREAAEAAEAAAEEAANEAENAAQAEALLAAAEAGLAELEALNAEVAAEGSATTESEES
ncbi:MAG: transcription termination factor NusA [Planctomycetes bacterium]|nr:transcription termination factor NusA [Planctomycetota bacterium]